MSDEQTEHDAEYVGEVRKGVAGCLARADGTDEDGRSRFIASTATVDRYGDVVEQSWRLKHWRANPVILYEHAVPVVGRGTAKIDREADALMLTVEWDDSERNPVGALAAHQHRTGFRSAVSVGFRPGKVISRRKLPDDDPRKVSDDVPSWQAGYVYRHNELLEVSSVAIPANPEALQARSWALEAEDPEEQVLRFLRETTPRKLRDVLADVLRHRPASLALLRSLTIGTPDPEPVPDTTPRVPWMRTREES